MIIVTTTPTVEGRQIGQYIRVVTGEVILGINFLRDMGAGFRNIFGGRSQGYEEEIANGRETALAEMVDRAIAMGADAVVGVDIDYESMGDGGMMMVAATGTAVKLR